MARARGWYVERIVGAMTLNAVACMPSADLDSYAQSEPNVIADEAVENAVAPSVSDPELVATAPETDGVNGTGPGTSNSGGTASEGCADGCPLLEPEASSGQGAASVKSLDAGSDAASNTGSEPSPPVSDAGSALPSCPASALLGPEDRCFVLATQLLPWSDARLACQARGAGWDLTTIRDAERNTWLIGLLGTVQDAWIGASDLESEGAWRWVNDSTAFWNGGPTGASVGGAFTSWNGGATPEPNGAEASDCLRLRVATGWADFQCATTYASICEGPSL